MKYIIITLLVLGWSTAQAEQFAGGQPGAYARRPVGARAIGMGEAYVAVADDPFAVYWNPAGLAHLKQPTLAGSYASLSEDRIHHQVAAGIPLGSSAGLGILWNRFGVNDIQGRTGDGTTTRLFDDAEDVFAAGLGVSLGSLSIGGTGKLYQQILDDFESHGYGYDVGALLTMMPFGAGSFLRIGAAVSDIDASIEWNTPSERNEQVPTTLRYGAAFEILNGEQALIVITGEVRETEYEGPVTSFGGEVTLLGTLSLRAGLMDESPRYGATIIQTWYQVHFSYGEDLLDETMTATLGFDLIF
jgi:hypothetical protein